MKYAKYGILVIVILVAVVISLSAISIPDLEIKDNPSDYLVYVVDWEHALREGTGELNGDYLDDNWYLHDPQFEDRYRLEGYQDWVKLYHGLMPDDFNYGVEGRETVDNLIAVVFTIKGTHTGDLEGLPATGNLIQLKGVLFHRFQDGKLVESWITYNGQRFLVQIGLEDRLYPACERDERKPGCA